MNTKYLLATLLALLLVGAAIRSRSTLYPDRGVDYVYYGAFSEFIAQEAATGDFNGDGLDDIVTAGRWDGPNTCDALVLSRDYGCEVDPQWHRWVFTKDAVLDTVCAFPDPFAGANEWQYWVDCGWVPIDTLSNCGVCDEALWQWVDRGAAFVFMGGDWSGKARDNDLSSSRALTDHMFVGQDAGDNIFNAMAAGDMDDDGSDELILGMPEDVNEQKGTGKVCVIRGITPGHPWPSPGSTQIVIPTDSVVTHVFQGRDSSDAFGMGVASGDLDGDDRDEVVVVAPYGDGAGNGRANSGEIYIFYSSDELPANVDLSMFASDQDQEMLDSTRTYLQVIWGAVAKDTLGITALNEYHVDGHHGSYEPVGVAIGDWDGDGYNDLAIGAGSAYDGAGVVYVIFGADRFSPVNHKLQAGYVIDLSATPGDLGGPDVRIVGKGDGWDDGGKLGAGIAFVDADGEGRERFDKFDLIMGAPMINPTVSSRLKSAGEAYIIFGDDWSELTSNNDMDLDVDPVDVTIKGQGDDDQLGGHISGNYDIDHDFKNDIGLAGHDIVFLLFGQPQAAWPSTLDLATAAHTYPETRFLSWTGVPAAASTTIRLLHLDYDSRDDLVFGGYDLPGYAYPAFSATHAGQMWVTKGYDMWRGGTISTNASWSGNIFVNRDVTVSSGHTLTIDPGTNIWVWPADADSAGADSARVEFNIEGQLVVNGTTANPVVFDGWEPQSNEDWVGFYFDNASGGAAFSHCIIRHAEYAIDTYADVSISDSRIESFRYGGIVAHNGTITATNTVIDGAGTGSYGLFLQSAGSVTGVTARNCTGVGIEVQPSGTLVAKACVIRANETGVYVNSAAGVTIDSLCVVNGNNVGVHCYDTSVAPPSFTSSEFDSNTTAIFCEYYSHPTIDDNTMAGNSAAVYCSDHSSPLITSNVITNNTNGILAAEAADPDIGHHGTTGQNSITLSSAYHVSNLTIGLTLMAEDNWWGKSTGPKTNKFVGSVDYNPWLSAPPSAAMSDGPVEKNNLPTAFALGAPFPNPFNPETTIRYDVPRPGGNVIIRIYDVSGRLVSELVDAHKAPGFYRVGWNGTTGNGTPVATGVYFVQMKAPAFTQSHKLLLLK